MKFNSKKNTVGLCVFFCIVSLVLFLVMASVLPFLGQAKGFPTADLLLCLVCAMSAFMDRKKACIFAVTLGFLADLFLFEPTAFSPVVYLLSALIVPVFHSYFTYLGSVVMAVCSVPACFIRSVLESVVTLTLFENVTASSVLSQITLPTFVVNFASSIVICFVCRLFVGKMRLSASL